MVISIYRDTISKNSTTYVNIMNQSSTVTQITWLWLNISNYTHYTSEFDQLSCFAWVFGGVVFSPHIETMQAFYVLKRHDKVIDALDFN